MAEQFDTKLFIFGDQTHDVYPGLKDVLNHRGDPVLENFLAKAYEAIRTEIFILPVEVRESLPRFTCLEDLAHWDRNGDRCIPLDMAVTCMYQLAAFMSQTETSSHGPKGRTQSRAHLGLCTGTLAAAAVVCGQDTSDFVPMAVDAVVVAFRTGLRVTDEGKRIQPTGTFDSDARWSIVVQNPSSAEVLERFCQQAQLPLTSKPYISAYSPNGITVSGPPASLARLMASKGFKDLRSTAIPIHGPYHAPHLYSSSDVSDIVGNIGSEKDIPASSEDVHFFSGSGTKIQVTSFAAVLKEAVGQILLHPIRWNDTLSSLHAWMERNQSKSVTAIPLGTSADQLINNALKQTSLRDTLPSTHTKEAQTSRSRDNVSTSNPKKPKLAIIGMSGRFPGAKDNEAFWDLLYDGLDVHKPVPDLHWDRQTHVDPSGDRKNTSATSFGCWLDDPAVFDARFFNISPREAPQIDPAQRLALMTAYEAIEQAGIVPDATPSTRRDRVGVFYGVTSNDWMETNSAQDIDTYFIPGGNRAFIPGRINYCFKFSGPSYAVDTACSSSLAGIHLACNALWNGEVDTSIAGGTNILTNPDFTAGLDRGHFLSRTGNCKTFDDTADGYCRGEGIGSIIIKRLDDALKENDPILGVILGISTNHSAESESITRPHSGAQRAIFSKILNQAAVDPNSVSYVEMHGTGTQAGDAGEMTSVLDTFAPPPSQVKRHKDRQQNLYLGSAKANIGHGEAASGVSSLIKVLLMMQKNTIVPHCGIKTKINHKFPTDLTERKVHIAREPKAWEKSADGSQPRRAFVNNFSAAGGNTALLLEDAPKRQSSTTTDIDPRSHHVIAVSAKSSGSLQGNLKSILQYLNQNPSVPLGQLSYTTTARRQHYQHRVMVSGSSSEEISAQIQTAIRENLGKTRPKSAPRVLFAFTGQGAQYPGMGKDLFNHLSLCRAELSRLDQIAQSLGFDSFLPVIQADESDDISDFAPCTTQLASVCLQISMSRLWASWGVTPVAVTGHSLGEYAALNTAGVLSDADTIYLVGKRAELLRDECEKDTHAMLVVKGSVDEIAAQLKDTQYEIACINSPVETVLAGPNENIDHVKDVLAGSGMRCTLLKVPYAFHSSQMSPILSKFTDLASAVTFSEATVPIICPLDGSVAASGQIGNFGPEYLARHCREPVNMFQALSAAKRNGIIDDRSTFMELGPHPAVSGMIRAVLGPQMATLASSQRGRSVWQVLSTSVKTLYSAGAQLRWQEYQRDFKASHRVLELPMYSWDLKEYWMQYVNDWSLRKGDPPLTVTDETSRLESTTIHRVIEDSGDSRKHRIVVEADIARKDLSPLVQGHEVDGIPLCTPSVYADIALSLGNHLLHLPGQDQGKTLVDVSDMTISKALILRAGATQQLIQAHGDVDWSSGSASVVFFSFDSKKKLQEHARCVIKFTDTSIQQQLQQDIVSLKAKLQNLEQGIVSGNTARFNRPMVYRAIRPLARFHDDYRAVDEIILNSTTLEASSRLSYGNVKREGDYNTHPAIIDSLTQSCGFAMNCNDGSDLDLDVFMNHGWGSLQIFEPMDFEKCYTTYTQMIEGPDKLWRGDVVVLQGDKVVAFLGQVAIQGVPRRVLKVILSIENGSKSQKQQDTRAKQPSVTGVAEPKTLRALPEVTTRESGSSKLAKALSIIAEESSLAAADLTDDTCFADVGIDSLLGLTISARFKEEMDTELDFNALFFEYPTVGDLKKFLGGDTDPNTSDAEIPASSYGSTSGSDSPRVSSSGTGATTPVTYDSDGGSKFDFQKALQIISDESGVAVEELTSETNFADSGVDSLLSLVIVSRLRDELDLDIQHESLFLDCPTVADLETLLVGEAEDNNSISSQEVQAYPHDNLIPEVVAAPVARQEDCKSQNTLIDSPELNARKKAVDSYVQKYTAGFICPAPSTIKSTISPTEKVVLITGATGSLGGHLVHHIAHLSDVKTVICLNRENKAEPKVRQQKAMREKGIRFPEALKSKLLILQTDSSRPMLGLSGGVYEKLVGSVTHIIHNAWPMSAKRDLSGFEPQFQVMRNLVDLAAAASGRFPEGVRGVSFQMVSSVGVVGHYGAGNGQQRTMVPEDRVGIDCVLPNGYSDAKWGCERMLDETLHKYPSRFRTMAVRLGQIAGSKTSGYWNPMEHFGFLIKSSQTLDALPDVDGTVFWTPVNDIAGALSDLVLSNRDPYPVYHIENPVGQPWREVNIILADALGITNLIPFDEWVNKVRNAPQKNNPASMLLEFLDSNYLRMSCGGLVLDVKRTLEHSKTLSAVGPVTEDVVRKYIHIWREIGFLSHPISGGSGPICRCSFCNKQTVTAS